MCYCRVVGSIRLVLLLCFKARRETGKEDWSGKSVETQRRNPPSRDAREERRALWAEKIITYIVNIHKASISFSVSPRNSRFNLNWHGGPS